MDYNRVGKRPEWFNVEELLAKAAQIIYHRKSAKGFFTSRTA